tara:strand:+ start:78 stop:242 length:165 start_codon:yes stop_codon:yes gene_type:complete
MLRFSLSNFRSPSTALAHLFKLTGLLPVWSAYLQGRYSEPVGVDVEARVRVPKL